MAAGQQQGTDPGIGIEVILIHLADVQGFLHVPELADVEAAAGVVIVVEAEKRIRRPLQNLLAGDDPFAVIRAILAEPGGHVESLKAPGGQGFFDLQHQMAAIDRREQNQIAAGTETADAHTVADNIADVELGQQHGHIRLDRLHIGPQMRIDFFEAFIRNVHSPGCVFLEDQAAAVVHRRELADDLLRIPLRRIILDLAPQFRQRGPFRLGGQEAFDFSGKIISLQRTVIVETFNDNLLVGLHGVAHNISQIIIIQTDLFTG